MRKEIYVCDRCGRELDIPTYTLKLECLSMQDRYEWHYCSDCWKKISNYLNYDIITINNVNCKDTDINLKESNISLEDIPY